MRGITVAEYAEKHGGEHVLLEWGEKNPASPEETVYVYREKMHWDGSSCGHSWEAIMANRVKKGQGCPECKVSKIVASRKATMDARLGTLADVHPEVEARWHPEKNLPLSPEDLLSNDKGKHWWLCPCGNEWEGAISGRVRREPTEPFTCPPCSYRRGGDRNAANALERNGSLESTHGELFLELHGERNLSELGILGEQLHRHSQVKVHWRCPECGSSYMESPARRVSIGAGCSARACIDARIGRAARLRSVEKFGSLLEERPFLCEEWDTELNTLSPEEVSVNSQARAWWRCRTCDYSWATAVRNRAVKEHECPRCRGMIVTSGVDDFATKHPELVHRFLSFQGGEEMPLSEVKFRSHRLARWACARGHVSVKSFSEMSANAGCRSCATSLTQIEVGVFLRSLLGADVPISENDRFLIRPREVDFYVPSFSLALEFNGDYWHSDTMTMARSGVDAATYHGEKVARCSERGVRLLYLWESQWVHSRGKMEGVLSDAFLRGAFSPELAILSMG